jgi:hypothetical protein
MKFAKIKSPAVKYQLLKDKGTDVFHYITGYCHSDCYNSLSFMEIYPTNRVVEVEEEGFMLEDGVFVNRFKAMGVALHNHQVQSIYTSGYSQLYSYMLKEDYNA